MKTNTNRLRSSTTLMRKVLSNVAESRSRRLTRSQFVESIKSTKKPLNESVDNNTPLAKTYTQWLKNGEVWSPVGQVVLADKLAPCPFRVKDTMGGTVFERMKPNTDEIINFGDGKIAKVVEEIDKFWSKKEAYNRLKILHNRGILLYGPPGTGKSICLQQVVEMMSARGDVVLFCDSPTTIKEGITAFRQVEPERKVVVCFEEADEMCRYNESSMLRLMDGDNKVNSVLYLATTNYIDRLPPRMLRPGRFDAKVFIGFPTMEQRKIYLNHKLKKENLATDAEIKDMAQKTEGFGFGHLRELIAGVYALGQPVDEVIIRLRESDNNVLLDR